MDNEKFYDLADGIYWTVLEVLNVENICVKDVDRAHGLGTENTELGTELYYAIEDIIFKKLDLYPKI